MRCVSKLQFSLFIKVQPSVLETIKPQFLKVTKFAEPNNRTKDFSPFLTLFFNKLCKDRGEKNFSSLPDLPLLRRIKLEERLIPAMQTSVPL